MSYEKMFQAYAGLLATVDANGHFRALNPTWERILGWSLDELRSKPFIEFVHPSDREVTLAEVAGLLQGNTVDRFDNRYLCKDGSYKWLGWAARVDAGDEPSEQLIYATGIDVTGDRERQSQLEPTLQDAKVYEKLFRVSVGLLVTLDSNGYFRHANPAWRHLLGWSPEEMTARPFIEFVHPDDRAATTAEAAALFEGKMTIRFDNRYQCKDGTYKWLAWTAYMDPNEDESTRLVYGTAHDVTPYKDLLGEYERTLERLRDTMEAMSTPFIPITERIVVMPLVGQMDTDRIHQVMTVALEGVQSTHVQVVILDVTGLRDLDTRVARALLDTAKGLQLLGAKTILTGIRPSLAQTLVGLGLDLGSIITKGTLQSAIASALQNDFNAGKSHLA
nr:MULTISPECIES: PAS domain S-box protein [unclassified Nannocystis]